ncbi:MAG TPA: hypothetical protein VG099_15285, partial [Gemmataceae bacterium]|nr:hypothetical protein [Gemmataceae bacterium]
LLKKDVWSIVQVPSVADEDRRQLHRDLLELKAEARNTRTASRGSWPAAAWLRPRSMHAFPRFIGMNQR